MVSDTRIKSYRRVYSDSSSVHGQRMVKSIQKRPKTSASPQNSIYALVGRLQTVLHTLPLYQSHQPTHLEYRAGVCHLHSMHESTFRARLYNANPFPCDIVNAFTRHFVIEWAGCSEISCEILMESRWSIRRNPTK